LKSFQEIRILVVKPKFHGSADFSGKTTNSVAGLKMLRATENCCP